MVKRQWFMGIMDEDRIFIKQDTYDPDINRVLKAELPGPAKWERDYKVFTFPMHWDTCVNARKVANKFDAEITIAPELKVWAANEKIRRESIPDVQSMALTGLPRVQQSHPPLWQAISSRPFQSVGAAFAARNGSCLIADQPGLGKTLQSIAAVIESGLKGPILVVAPKAAAKLVWPQELARWVPDDDVYIIGSHVHASERARIVGAAREWAPGERVWLLTSPNYVRIKAEVDEYNHFVKGPDGKKKLKAVGEAVMELFDVEWSAVIVDESHQTLAGASGDIKKQSAQRVGLGALSVKQGGLRLALSGTPERGRPEYLWGQLNWLRPDLYRSRWRWIKEWFDVYQDRYGMVIGHMTDRQGMYKQAATVMIRRTKEEVAKDLPAKAYNDIWLDMDGKQLKAYRDMEKLAQADLEGGILQTTAMLAELTRLKQFAGSYGKMVDGHFTPTLPSNKFDWLVEWLDERGIDKAMKDASSDVLIGTPKVVVASQFSQLIDCFAEGLAKEGVKTHKFTGSTSDKDRERIKDDFQNNPESETRVLLLTTTAGGVALTLDAADELVVLDETWNTSDQEQLEDRLHRLSRMHQVTIWNVRSINTIEESIAKKNAEAEFSIKSILDGARGVELVKELFKK